MSLESNYELLEMVRDDGVQTFRGREIATGRNLEIHLFIPFGRPENKALFERLKGLPLGARRHFLDLGSDGSTPYIVTDPLPDARGFKAWAEGLGAPVAREREPLPERTGEAPGIDESVQILQAGQWRTGTPIPESLVMERKITTAQPLAQVQPPTQAQPLAATQRAAPEDLTVMFKAPSALPPLPPKVTPPERVPERLPDTERMTQPGEFTGLFQGDVSRAQNRDTQPNVALPFENVTKEVDSDSGPGEFTRMFKMPAPPAKAPHMPPATASSAPPATRSDSQAAGEFTRMFQAPGHAIAAGPPAASGSETAQAGKPETAPGGGEFTKFFQNPMQPGPLGSAGASPQALPPAMTPPPPPPSPRRGSEFTEVFGKPAGSGQPVTGPPFTPPPAPIGGTGTDGYGSSAASSPSATGAFFAPGQTPQASQPQRFGPGPSEYTKMISGAAVPTLGQAPVGQAPPPPAVPVLQPAKSNLPLYSALGVLAVLVILLVIFFALRHR